MATSRRRAGVVGTALAVGALALVGGVVASPAAASTEQFLKKVHDAGVASPPTDVELREMGWEVCALFARGVAPRTVLRDAVNYSRPYPPYGMTPQQANVVVDAAVTELCNAYK
jgi:hypothetical protein